MLRCTRWQCAAVGAHLPEVRQEEARVVLLLGVVQPAPELEVAHDGPRGAQARADRLRGPVERVPVHGRLPIALLLLLVVVLPLVGRQLPELLAALVLHVLDVLLVLRLTLHPRAVAAEAAHRKGRGGPSGQASGLGLLVSRQVVLAGVGGQARHLGRVRVLDLAAGAAVGVGRAAADAGQVARGRHLGGPVAAGRQARPVVLRGGGKEGPDPLSVGASLATSTQGRGTMQHEVGRSP